MYSLVQCTMYSHVQCTLLYNVYTYLHSDAADICDVCQSHVVLYDHQTVTERPVPCHISSKERECDHEGGETVYQSQDGHWNDRNAGRAPDYLHL